MDASMDQTILRHEVSDVCFGFYSDDEIRALSVKQISSRVSFDSLKNPVIGGLYDPALGPIDFNMICPTCHMTQKECPGHLGHIELPVPVYSPVLFATMLNILKRKCMSCHKFRKSASTTRIYRVRLLLLDNGYIDEAAQMLELLDQKDGNFEEGYEQTVMRQQAILDEYERLALSGTATYLPKNPRSVEVERDNIINSFLKGMTYKCENCEAHSPGVRQDSHAKIFLKPLSLRSQRHNQSRAVHLNSAFEMININDKKPAADDSDSEADEDMDAAKDEANTSNHTYLAPLEVMSQMQLLWQNEEGVTELMWGNRTAASRRGKNHALDGWKKFFLNVIPVAPSRFRPPVIMGDSQFEHSQNIYLSKIISLAEQMVTMGNARRLAEEEAPQSINLSDKIYLWTELQTQVNCLIDNSKAKRPEDMPQGIKQLIEKKEGLFRKHMMGKRVNYAARSVISPDPYISTSEIGVPLRFAKTLTLPQAVTPWNVIEMRQLVENGPDIHPGANFVENERGQLIDLSKRTLHQRRAIGKTLLTRSASAQGAHQKHKVKRVWRHLKSGDVVLMNRQPTLHKPSMMAHVTRVLTNPAMQTIRMHYANCNTFNADFDGDEMNMHFPQNELARSEAYNIANNDNQYLVPTDGSPLRGLIQDHVDSGVKLTQRDTFLTKDMYLQLVYSAWTCLDGEKGVIKTLPPTILKPQPLWTGKQVMSTIVLMLTAGKPSLNLNSKAKIKADLYGPGNAEHIIIFRDGELLQGVLDKAQFGASEYGWVHACYELYGSGTAAKLLTALGRVLTCYLQYSGHTCALEDLTLNEHAEKERRRLVEQSVVQGEIAYSEFAGLSGLGDKERRMNDEERAKIRDTMQLKMAQDLENTSAALDSHMMGFVHGSNSEIIKSCLPHGQNKSFPANCFSLMVLTGAKGSMVNHSQISCGLGQQALEGRRVPVLVSGKSLPSFEPFDPSPRAGGYITDRFLTGLRPQEYYHHCMAGREGLVDTAVKTSRSGYLQRCLIKHLEDLHVAYDHTVRNCDGNVVQFLYGEDGVDTINSAFLSGKPDQMSFLAMNHASLTHKFGITAEFLEKSGMDVVEPAKIHHQIKDAKRRGYENGDFELHTMKEGLVVLARRLKDGHHKWKKGHFELGWHEAVIKNVDDGGEFPVYDLTYKDTGLTVYKVPEFKFFKASTSTMPENAYMAGNVQLIKPQLPDPVMHALQLNNHIGCVSEKTQQHIETYSKANPSNLLESKKNKIGGVVSSSAFRLMVWVKYMRSLCQPGENVGTICAQSIGEPSTQMTLNTFHLAGHGAANVTLGIPRLREIIMTASKKMSTPMMTIPVLPTATPAQAVAVEQKLNQVPLAELIRNTKGIRVQDQFLESENRVLWCREYTIRLYFFKPKLIREAFGITTKEIQRAFGKSFVSRLLTLLKHEMRKSGVQVSVENGSMSVRSKDNIEEEDAEPTRRAKKQKDDDEDDDEDQGTLKFGSQKEAAGYGEMDDDDVEIQKAQNTDDQDMDESAEKSKQADGSDTENSSDDEDVAPIKVIKGELKPVNVTDTVNKNPYFAGAGVNTTEHYGELKLRFPANFKTLLLVPLIEKIASQVLVRSCDGISRCYTVKQRLDKSGKEEQCIQTQGLNFEAIWELDHVLDVNRLVTNDIYQVLLNYGVEAARASISKQIQDVFGVYGISVDPRHLSLLADYMTHYGDYMPLNRSGMARKGSSFQQITFETSMKFLTQAATGNFGDNMSGPSARLVLGQPVKLGTGLFSLMTPIAL
ncbi:DNA-directed RNA polymerase I subunit RPA1 [Thraustotheca clavata]|uniref:DNA-directed RNA polymerase subunit n=1 Tax=Thraustotheca clavata TaxID=74557 RepID=A0A1V9ZEK2_9STRA|nr:DNA-directed RNA polymerase I subunit RPA1 [Thraustotheca clavata]